MARVCDDPESRQRRRMQMRLPLVFFLALALWLAVAAGAGPSRAQTCPPRSIGPGALLRGGTAGADCLLHAYRHGCPSAQYALSSFGVDTIATLRFTLVRRNGKCAITVTRSFRVVPQKPRTTAAGTCKTLRKTATDIVAAGCSGDLSPTTSLTR
jgi:hypothetical protein